MMEAASTPNTLVNFYQTTWNYHIEDSHLQSFSTSPDICRPYSLPRGTLLQLHFPSVMHVGKYSGLILNDCILLPMQSRLDGFYMTIQVCERKNGCLIAQFICLLH
jgi:hypothetical protein